MEKCYLVGSRAFGDTLCSTPILRKLSTSYGEKFHVVTHNPIVFQNNPYVLSVEKFDGDENEKAKECEKKYETFKTFFKIADHGTHEPERKHNTYDIRQFHATELGMMLKPKEMHCDFYPEPINQSLLDSFPSSGYVCIHAASTWPSRTWSVEKFQDLVDGLNDSGVPVIIVGKDNYETGFWGRQEKTAFPIEVKRGINFCNKLSLDETWHVINNSSCFVTMDSGLLHLAGTTETHIIQLGSSIDPILRAPYRKASQDYKYEYVKGPCDIFCGSDVKYGIPEWGSIHGVPPIISCLEKKETFECHPEAEQVKESCIKAYSSFKGLEKSQETKKTKVLLVAEHLSTGGMPEVFRKRLETLLDAGCDVYVVEFSFWSGAFVVQREKILNMVPEDRFITLGNLNEEYEDHVKNRLKLMDIIQSFQPDYVHLEEVPEKYSFAGFPDELARKLYSSDRKYKIFETSHDSGFEPNLYKKYLPDKFIFISKWHIEKYKNFNVPKVVIEYPIEKKERPNREESLRALGLDPSYKHVLNVGLFTRRKNQGEIFEYAKKLKKEKILFHFIGNLASNFEEYWGPVVESKTDNCIIWGERDDVEKFYQCMDLFCFTSKGSPEDRETNPIVIKEALSWGMKLALRNLEVYMGAYDDNPDVTFLSNDIEENCETISNILNSSEESISLPPKVVITHTTEQYLKTAECLVKSLAEFSEVPIALYTMNCEADYDYPNLIKIPYYTDYKKEPELVRDQKGDYFKKGTDEGTFRTLTQKAGVMLDALDKGAELCVYVDTDMICNINFDSVFDHAKELENYPLVTEGPFFVMASGGEYGVEKPLMDLMNVPEQNRTWYRQTNTILFSPECRKFIEEWDSLCKDKYIMSDWRRLTPYHEETIVNVLFWKYNLKKCLPQTFLNTVNVDTIKYFDECNVEDIWNEEMNRAQIAIHEHEGSDRGWLCFKKDKSLVKLFHGMKDPEKMNECIEYLKILDWVNVKVEKSLYE